jgi:hypothetical protein
MHFVIVMVLLNVLVHRNSAAFASAHDLIGRHDWFYYTSTKCAIPDDMAGQQRF